MPSLLPEPDPEPLAGPVSPEQADGADYQVVARRYRPQTFADLVGQTHVAQALAGAINSHRVGHAYLFTGARGVGKTSTARILAKALNCASGPTPTPCNACDMCQGIASGDDVDVLEIDGASNRGIDEMRELRQNVNMRPSRARYKIYIIDEVHMLTREAFNALLKTLEEPPEHVKFIFCTTEAEKIPVTILSRCQRFDFAGIPSRSIAERLRQIAARERFEVDEAAIDLLARRAAGSMRDGQSLLEQLLAVGEGRLSLADVHRLLGTADDSRVLDLVERLANRDPAGALEVLDAAVSEGVDVGQLIEQLFGAWRDMMVAAVGGRDDLLTHTPVERRGGLPEAAQALGLETILAALAIVEQTLARLRFSTHPRLLAEMALVRIAHLEQLEDLASLVRAVESGEAGVPTSPQPVVQGARPLAPAADAGKKNGTLSNPPPGAVAPTVATTPAAAAREAKPAGLDALGPQAVRQAWDTALGELGGMLAEYGLRVESLAIPAPNRLVATFPAGYSVGKDLCEKPEQRQRIEAVLGRLLGQSLQVDFLLAPTSSDPAAGTAQSTRPARGQPAGETWKSNPFFAHAAEVFDFGSVRLQGVEKRAEVVVETESETASGGE